MAPLGSIKVDGRFISPDEQQQLCTQQADADVEMSVAEGSGGQSATDTPTADAAEPKTEQQSEANMPECGTP